MPIPFAQHVDAIPISFQEVGGGTFLVRDGRKSSDDLLAATIRRSGGVACAEEDCNRFFIVSDFFDVYCSRQQYTDENLVTVAKAYAAKLHLLLQAAFPSKQFTVEIVGDHLVDEEPLELCVTFTTEV